MSIFHRFSEKRKTNLLSRLSVNSIFLILNIALFFVFTIFLAYNFLSMEMVAIKPLHILQGKYLWTFITSMFMHAGFFHLFANMFSLLFIGSLVEKIIGPRRYLLFYLTAGLFAGLFFVLSAFVFPSDANTFAVGASGAIFGLVGLLMILTPNLPVYIMLIPIPVKMKYAAPGILILLWLISIAGNVQIGNTAHLGGLLAGLVYGFYLKNKYKNKTKIIEKYFS